MRSVAEVKADIHECFRRGEHEMEAGYPYENPLNDLQRELIAAYEREHGQAWLGNVNLYHCRCDIFVGPGPICADCGKTRHDAPIIWRWQGDTVLNFGARFVIDHFDLELERLILERDRAPYTGTKDDYARIEQIFERIHALGGESLTWN